MQQPSVLLVEDDAFQRKAAETYLMNHDLRVIAVENGAQMRHQVSRAMPDLVLLDVQLPGQEDGFALARWLRESSTRVGIIMLTAAGDSVDKVLGLESGADDYVAKPYEPRELLARCKSVLRRSVNKSTPSRLERVRMGRTCSTSASAPLHDDSRQGRGRDRGRIRHPEDLRREPQPAAEPRLAAGDHQPPRAATRSTGRSICASPASGARSSPRPRSRRSFAPCAASAICSCRPPNRV